MKPNTTDRAVTGNLQGERITMGFKKGAEKHLMGLMASMYSDMELAIIREYSTNAHDSHLEAGQTRPIEVTLPTPLSPYLKIKDYGVGMNVDDIHETYSQYGASTKRDSNEFNGMLGIGSKSALAYSGQFTVVATKNGVRTTAAVTRDQDGSNTMVIVDTSSTPDGNGVEIAIPVKGGNQIEAKARNFFKYWPTGTVLLNGLPAPKPEAITSIKISDSIDLVKVDRYGTEQSIVVMGNVPYPAGDALHANSLGIPHGYAIVARVGMGDVDFAPSREALMFSKHTNDKLAQIAAEFKAGLIAAVQKEIENAPTAQAAVKAMTQWAKLLGRNRPATFRHKGRLMPSVISPPDTGGPWTFLITGATDYDLARAGHLRVLELEYVTKAVFVTGFDLAKHTVTHKKKLLQWWANDSNLTESVTNFVLVNFPLDTHWIDPKRVVAWSTIQQQKLATISRTVSGRLPGSYNIVVCNPKDGVGAQVGIEGSKIDRTNPVFWIHGNDSAAFRYTDMLRGIYQSYTIICLGRNRIDKFKRDNPSIPNVLDAVKDTYRKWTANITAGESTALAIAGTYNAKSMLSALGKSGVTILDPEVANAIKLAQKDTTILSAAARNFARYGFSYEPKWKNPLTRYPLANDSAIRYHPREVAEYINMIWKLT